MLTTLKEYYKSHWPEDPCGDDIDGRATFLYLWTAMAAGIDVYDVIGIGDSFVREGLFSGLAEMLGVEYDVVYKVWLASLARA